jgi:hypothetical protein
MADFIGIVSACGLAALVALGFVMWERYEDTRLARERMRRRVPRRSGTRRRPLDIDRRAA